MERRRFREAIGCAGKGMMKLEALGVRRGGKLQAPSGGRGGKLQAPSTKLQRSSKFQAAKARNRSTARVLYSDGDVVAARLAENGNGASRHPFDLEERTAVFGE